MLPENIVSQMKVEDADMLSCQLQALPGDLREQVLQRFRVALAAGKVSNPNPVGWLLAVMKRAREGALFNHVSGREDAAPPATTDTSPPCRPLQLQRPRRVSSPERVSSVVAEIRRKMVFEKGLK
jgi:hypothetical protein